MELLYRCCAGLGIHKKSVLMFATSAGAAAFAASRKSKSKKRFSALSRRIVETSARGSCGRSAR